MSAETGPCIECGEPTTRSSQVAGCPVWECEKCAGSPLAHKAAGFRPRRRRQQPTGARRRWRKRQFKWL